MLGSGDLNIQPLLLGGLHSSVEKMRNGAVTMQQNESCGRGRYKLDEDHLTQAGQRIS